MLSLVRSFVFILIYSNLLFTERYANTSGLSFAPQVPSFYASSHRYLPLLECLPYLFLIPKIVQIFELYSDY